MDIELVKAGLVNVGMVDVSVDMSKWRMSQVRGLSFFALTVFHTIVAMTAQRSRVSVHRPWGHIPTYTRGLRSTLHYRPFQRGYG